jgi:hypothetical protein
MPTHILALIFRVTSPVLAVVFNGRDTASIATAL